MLLCCPAQGILAFAALPGEGLGLTLLLDFRSEEINLRDYSQSTAIDTWRYTFEVLTSKSVHFIKRPKI